MCDDQYIGTHVQNNLAIAVLSIAVRILRLTIRILQFISIHIQNNVKHGLNLTCT